MLLIGLMLLANFFTPIMVIIIPIVLIISIIMRIFGCFDDDLAYSYKGFAGFALATLICGSIVEFFAIIPMIVFAFYILFCVIDDVGNTNILLLPIRYLWADIHGIFYLVLVILALIITAVQVALIAVAVISIIPILILGMPSLDTFVIVKLLNASD